MSAAPIFHHLKLEEVGDITVVGFVDKRITESLNIQALGDELFRLVDELGRRKLLLDFSTVAFMSTALVGKLSVLHHKKLQPVQGKVVLCGLSPDLMAPFTITKLDSILTIVADRATAIQSF